jgi:hypothetical protein
MESKSIQSEYIHVYLNLISEILAQFPRETTMLAARQAELQQKSRATKIVAGMLCWRMTMRNVIWTKRLGSTTETAAGDQNVNQAAIQQSMCLN